MADKAYDAIVIGSGHNGLIAACYLQEAGLSTVVLEKYHEVGGGVSGLEVPLPGFLANDCAADIRINQLPVYQDLELYNYGYKGIFPDAVAGTIFDDETCIVAYAPFVVADEKASRLERSNDNIQKTMKEIARFSERDAETYLHIVDCWEKKWRDAYWEWRYNPPFPWSVRDPIERLVEDKECPIDPRWLGISLEEFARDLFDSEEMQLHFLAIAHGWVGAPATVIDFSWICFIFCLAFGVNPREIVKGGTHTFAHALQRRFSSKGGEFFVESEVDKVLVENGKARGVRLVDGTEIEARMMVVSNQDLLQTLFRFIGEEYFDSSLVRKIKKSYYVVLKYYPDVLWGHFAVHELPKYKAESFNPDCGRLASTQIVPKDIEWYYRSIGALQGIKAIDSPRHWDHHQDSLFDRRAPDGKHQLMIEQFGILPEEPTERGYRELKKGYPERLLREWEKYAPNMTRENLIGSYFYAGADLEKKGINVRGWPGPIPPGLTRRGRNLPVPELNQYRMLPIKNYYFASPFAHEGGCVIASPGYNCYKIIAQDFGLRKPWEEKGRPY